MSELKKRAAALLAVKSIVTLAMTGAMIVLLFTPAPADPELRSVFCTAYGSIITYFFTRKEAAEK